MAKKGWREDEEPLETELQTALKIWLLIGQKKILNFYVPNPGDFARNEKLASSFSQKSRKIA